MSRNRAIRILVLLAGLTVGGPAVVEAVTEIEGDLRRVLFIGYFAYLSWAALTVLIGNCLVALWGTPRLAARQLAFVQELAGRQQAVAQ